MSDVSSPSPLLAVNICLLPPPGHPIYERAHRLQSLMLSSYPSDYRFSSTRFAHVTLVQSYVDTAALPALIAALKEEVSGGESGAALTLTARSDIVAGPIQEGHFVPSIAISPSSASAVPPLPRDGSRPSIPTSSSSPLLQSVEAKRAAFYSRGQ